MNKEKKFYDIGVFIGRFEPFHKGHLHNIEQGLLHCKKMVILVGSSFRSRSVKNPFLYSERKKFIEEDLYFYNPSWKGRIIILPLQDFLYNETYWNVEVKKQVLSVAKENEKIAIIGYHKDSSSYYLMTFPTWGFINVNNFNNLNATDLRVEWFQGLFLDSSNFVSKDGIFPENGTFRFLENFKKTECFEWLKEDYFYYFNYKKTWQTAPYPVIFNTVDALVMWKDCILLVQRKFTPSRGMWALPGGFLEKDEFIAMGIIRELREESCLCINRVEILKSLKFIKNFDHPDRSSRGRVITHVGVFDLLCDEKPKLQANEYSLNAQWVTKKDCLKMAEQLFEDHHQIISNILTSLES